MSRNAELLAAVYAAPDDDDARLVYADWLQEHGDARGELIALQIARARGPTTTEQNQRERELLAEHKHAWLAPLPILGTTARFTRGFVARCQMTGGFLDDDPAWATVEAVDSVPATDACHTHSLRALTSVGNGGIVQLARLARPLAVESLAWNGPQIWGDVAWTEGASWGIDAWSEIRVLPKLRTLALHGQATWVEAERAPMPRQFTWAWTSRYLPVLAELALPIPPIRLADWADALAPTRLHRAELWTESYELRPRAWRLILDRDERGQLSRLTVIAPARLPSQLRDSLAMDQVVAGVRGLPLGLTRAVVQVPGSTWDAFAGPRGGLAAALAEHPRAAVSIEPVAG